MSNLFIFSLKSPSGSTVNFSLTRPPFGWNYIPTISNSIMHSIIDSFNSSIFSSLIYVDDVFSFSLLPLFPTITIHPIVGSAMPLSPKQVQCMAGTFQWASLHNFFACPFFYSLHCFSPSTKILLSRGARAALIKAHLLSSTPCTPNDFTIGYPPPNTPLVFCDASYTDSAAACTYISATGTPLYIR